eukprot:g27266.t1
MILAAKSAFDARNIKLTSDHKEWNKEVWWTCWHRQPRTDVTLHYFSEHDRWSQATRDRHEECRARSGTGKGAQCQSLQPVTGATVGTYRWYGGDAVVPDCQKAPGECSLLVAVPALPCPTSAIVQLLLRLLSLPHMDGRHCQRQDHVLHDRVM